MTREQAEMALKQAERHTNGIELVIIPSDCPGGYALFSPAEVEGVGYLLTEYDINLFEPIQAIGYAPPLQVTPTSVLLTSFRTWLQQQGYGICELDGTGYATTVEDSTIDALIRRYGAEQEVTG